jgi:hypothetical protein
MKRVAAARLVAVAPALALTLAAGLAAPAMGQSVGFSTSLWTQPGPFRQTETLVGDAAATGGLFSLGFDSSGGFGAVYVGDSGRATDAGINPLNRFTLATSPTLQSVRFLEPGRLVLPTIQNGQFEFFGGVVPGNNISAAQYAVRVQVRPDLGGGMFGAPVFDQTVGDTRVLPGNLSSGTVSYDRTNLLTTPELAAGRYRVEMTLSIQGTAAAADPNNGTANVEVRFDGGNGRGVLTSAAFLPTRNAPIVDSRAVVRAPQARATFGVTGDRITVGQLELGMTSAHESLGARLLAPETGLDNPGGDYRREHALFVSSIIASQSANPGEAGVAPDARIINAPLLSYLSGENAFNALLNRGVTVINMSAQSGDLTVDFVDGRLNANPLVTFVKSAGNNGGPTMGGPNVTISQPGLTRNGITVGALNRDATQRAEFSSFSFSGAVVGKPDLVAPGEMVLGASSRDTSGDGRLNDFNRVFLGADYNRPLTNAVTGEVSGTSFSTPFVSGAVALLQDYGTFQGVLLGTHDATATDSRVMKAVLINGADTNIRRSTNNGFGSNPAVGGNGPWSQRNVINGGVRQTEESLDASLGGGRLDAYQSLAGYQREIREADSAPGAAPRNRVIDSQQFFLTLPTQTVNNAKPMAWDYEIVGSRGGVNNIGTVDYLLGDIVGQFLRSTLTWHWTAAEGLANLNLRLFMEGGNMGNNPGYDPAVAGGGDMLIAETVSVNVENVKLIDWTIPAPGMGATRRYYLQVVNNSAFEVTYGLAVIIPTPSALGVLIVAAAAGVRRRRRA